MGDTLSVTDVGKLTKVSSKEGRETDGWMCMREAEVWNKGKIIKNVANICVRFM
jgi:hypothetical protein